LLLLHTATYPPLCEAGSRTSRLALVCRRPRPINAGVRSIDLSESDDPSRATAGGDEILEAGARSTDPDAHLRVYALFAKRRDLAQLGRREQAIECFDAATAQFGDVDDPYVRQHVACALGYKAFVLDEMGRRADAEATVKEIDARCGTAAEPEVRAEALDIYENAIERYEGDPTPDAQAALALTLANKAEALFGLDRVKDAERVADQIVARWGDSADLELRWRVASALRSKGKCLERRHRPDLARKVYDELSAPFPAHDSAEIYASTRISDEAEHFRSEAHAVAMLHAPPLAVGRTAGIAERRIDASSAL
jgi:tetratricopeptide (TPR) repeat protein